MSPPSYYRSKQPMGVWESGQYTPGSFLKGWMPPHPTFFVRKEVYQKYGGFNTNLKLSADYELMLRFIHKHEIKIAYLKETIVKRQGYLIFIKGFEIITPCPTLAPNKRNNITLKPLKGKKGLTKNRILQNCHNI